MSFFSGDGIAIDLGSANTTIYLENQGIVLREPTSVLVMADDPAQVYAVGGDAYAMGGRGQGRFERLSPVMDGAVTDADMAALLMVSLAERATGRRKPMEKAQLLVSMSQGLTKVEKAALIQAVRMTGAKRAVLVKTPVAAALGAGLKVDDTRALMIVVLGGGTTEIAVIASGAIAAARSMRTGTLSMDEAIARHIRREKGVVIGLTTAEDLKCDIGSAELPEEEAEGAQDGADDKDGKEEDKMEAPDEGEKVLLKGRDAKTGQPTTVEITPRDIALGLEGSIALLVDALRDALSRVPPELAADILDAGICLSGGGALLKGLAPRLAAETAVPVSVGEHPHEDVILGLGTLAADERLLKLLLMTGAAEEL
ncbi:rod shape-determining protein [Bacillota bacterium Meth-B3]